MTLAPKSQTAVLKYTHVCLGKWSLLSMPLGLRKLDSHLLWEPSLSFLCSSVSPSQLCRKASASQVCEGQPSHSWAGAGRVGAFNISAPWGRRFLRSEPKPLSTRGVSPEGYHSVQKAWQDRSACEPGHLPPSPAPPAPCSSSAHFLASASALAGECSLLTWALYEVHAPGSLLSSKNKTKQNRCVCVILLKVSYNFV